MPQCQNYPVNWLTTCSSRLVATGVLLALIAGCSTEVSVVESKPSQPPVDRRGPFCLSTEFYPIPAEPGLMRFPLTRELGRQAILIAARDGLGLATHDETLGERLPDFSDPARSPLTLRVRAFNEDHGSLILESMAREASSTPPTELGRFDFRFQGDTFNMYTALAAVLGPASRDKLVEVLQDAGYSGSPIVANASAPLPDGVESQLAKMDFVSQFSAVQRIHASIAEDGESAARLGGLVRGYANLAMLTRHHWNSANAAFAARSLLYAERLMAVSDNPRLARHHRAYARAVVGLHGMALQDLERLPESDDAGANAPSDPSWTKSISPFCRFDEERLAKLSDEPGLQQLVPQLRFELNRCYLDERWNTAAGPAALAKCPESYGIYSALANNSPMLSQRRAVHDVAETFGRQLPRRVAALDGVPKEVVGIAGKEAGPQASWIAQWLRGERESNAGSPLPMKMAVALGEVESQPEPSWQVLAALINNEQFVEIADNVMVAMNAVEYSKQEMVDQFAPLVEGHPYAAYIRSYALDRNRQPEEFAELASQVTVRDPRTNMQRMFNLFWVHTDGNGQRYCDLSREALWQHDYTAPAMIASLERVDDSWWQSADLLSHFQRFVLDMQAIAPHAPSTLRMEINTTVDPSDEQLSKWEELGKDDPEALAKIAQLYNQREDFDAAIRCYDRSYELSPSHSKAIGLATAYRSAKREDNWLPALEDYLQREDYALGHAFIHQHIAQDYITKGKWTDAEPHALAAAQTWSAWGLVLAGQVCEGLGRWDDSEKWFREAVQNYPTYSGYQWYFWCRRTGRGDVAAARKAFDVFLQLDWVRNCQQNENYPVVDKILSGEYQLALDDILARTEYADDNYWQLHAVLLAKRAGNDAQYAELTVKVVKLVEEQYHDSDPKLCALFQMIQQLQEQGSLSDDQIASVDSLFSKYGPISRTNYGYFFAEQLALHGDMQHAERYWRMSLDAGQLQKYNATLSGHRLAELHGTSRPDQVEAAETEEDPAENSI